MSTYETREAWLSALADKIIKDKLAIYTLEPYRVSCGWPVVGGRPGSKKQRLGECHAPQGSADQHGEIFVTPNLSEPVQVGAVLVHELVHHTVGCKVGHRAPFKRLAVSLGLVGKMTSTAAGPELSGWLQQATNELGTYPHAVLNCNKDRKKQSTRLVKAECPECGYVIRTTRKWIDEIGLPTCACGTEFQEGE